MTGGQLHCRALDRLFKALIVRAHRDAALRADGLNRVLQDFDKCLLHLGLVKINREQPLFQVKRPDDPRRARLLKRLNGPAQHVVQIPRRLGARVLLLSAAEGSEVLGDFRRLLCRPFHFHQRVAPRVVRFHFAQNKRRVAEDTGQSVVEIKRNRAGQLQGAFKLLPLRRAGLERKRARS